MKIVDKSKLTNFVEREKDLSKSIIRDKNIMWDLDIKSGHQTNKLVDESPHNL